MRRAAIFFLLSMLLLGGRAVLSEERAVVALAVTGAIDPVVSLEIAETLEEASRAGAPAVLLRLDTPGGLLDATREIVQNIVNSPVPVIVYVSPRGARAASAGLFITLAADAAVMAPETHLGAAHPVSLGGFGEKAEKSSGKDAVEEKAVSDTAAYARGLAAARGRNADWAEKAVRESLSMTAEEAAKSGVVDFVAVAEAELLAALDGKEIAKGDKTIRLALKDAPVRTREMSRSRRLLHVLANPSLAYLLIVLGFYALIYEFATPGVGLGAAVGLICLVLAFFSLQVLPLNYAGLALLVTGLAMMALEIFVPSHGLLMVGGALSLAAGSLFLFDRAEPYYRVPLQLVGGSAAGSAVFLFFVVAKVFAVRRMKPATGAEAMVGSTGEVREGGMVFLRGEYWTAEGAEGLAAGDRVTVVSVKGNRLSVRKL